MTCSGRQEIADFKTVYRRGGVPAAGAWPREQSRRRARLKTKSRRSVLARGTNIGTSEAFEWHDIGRSRLQSHGYSDVGRGLRSCSHLCARVVNHRLQVPKPPSSPAGRQANGAGSPTCSDSSARRPSVQNVPAPDVNPLLAFPSETGPRPEAVPAVGGREEAGAQAERAREVEATYRPMLIVLVVVALPSLGVLAIRRFPHSAVHGERAPDGEPDDCDAARRFGGAHRWRAPRRDAADAAARARRAHDHHPERERRARGAADDCGRRRGHPVLRDEGRRAGGCSSAGCRS